jgi:hypothetical protein
LAGLEIFANQAQTTVSSGGTTAPSAGTSQTWTVASSTGFPAASSTASPPTFFRVTDLAASSEKMIVTNVSGTTWTVTRGAEGTTPVTHTSGFTVQNVITAAALEELVQAGTTGLVLPSGDTSGATDTSAINAVAQAGQLASLATGALYYVTNLLPDSLGGIDGNGATLQVATGTTGYAIALKTPATTKQVKLRNFVLNCDDICAGIQIDNTGFDPEVQWVPYDPMHWLDSVLVLAANGDAYHLDNQVRSVHATDCVQYNCSGYGLYCGDGAASDGVGATDNHFTNFISGHSGLDGMHFEAASGNNGILNCKAFYAGYTEADGAWTSTTAVGLYNAGNNNRITGFSAQQNALHGITLNGCSYTSVIGGQADTNSAGTDVTTGCGVNLTGTITNCSVIGVTGSLNTYDPPGAQAYGIQLDGTLVSTSVIGNPVTGTNAGINETDNFVDGGYNTIADASQFTLDAPMYLRANPGAWFLGQTSAPAAGQYFTGIWGNDPTGNGYVMPAAITGAGVAGSLQMAQGGTTASIGSSTTETAVASMSVLANDPQATSVYKLTGYATTVISTTAPTITWRIRWGGTSGTVLAVTGALAETASSTGIWKFEGLIVFESTTTATAKLDLTYNLAGTSETPGRFGTGTSAIAVNTTATTVTTASTESLVLTAQFGGANSQSLSAVGYAERIA